MAVFVCLCVCVVVGALHVAPRFLPPSYLPCVFGALREDSLSLCVCTLILSCLEEVIHQQ